MRDGAGGGRGGGKPNHLPVRRVAVVQVSGTRHPVRWGPRMQTIPAVAGRTSDSQVAGSHICTKETKFK